MKKIVIYISMVGVIGSEPYDKMIARSKCSVEEEYIGRIDTDALCERISHITPGLS